MTPLTTAQAIRVWDLIALAPSAAGACRLIREYLDVCDEAQVTKMWTKYHEKFPDGREA